jgi:hypothetical protein
MAKIMMMVWWPCWSSAWLGKEEEKNKKLKTKVKLDRSFLVCTQDNTEGVSDSGLITVLLRGVKLVVKCSGEPNGSICGGSLFKPLAVSGSLSWPFELTKQPCELNQSPPTHLHHWFIIFVRLWVNPSALFECLHLEALGVRVSLWDSLVTLVVATT